MRKKKALKLSVNEIKKYCPFVRKTARFYKEGVEDQKRKVVLSMISDLCPVGKVLNREHVILIDDKSKKKVCDVLNDMNMNIQMLRKYIEGNEGKEKKSLHEKETKLMESSSSNNESVELTDSNYKVFKERCNNNLKEHINRLFLDRRYRIFTILRKYRDDYPGVFIENNRLYLSQFYDFYQKNGYKGCIGDHIKRAPYIIGNCLQESTKSEGIDSSVDPMEKTVLFCSNDYLCLANHPRIIDIGIETLKKVGNSSGGTRNISGSFLSHTHLEYILARWYKKDGALLFTSGYIANVGALETLGRLLNLIFVSDELNHASMINGIRESRKEKFIFKHNDMNDLERILKHIRSEKEYAGRQIMIVFESVYSMNGSISKIPKIIELAKKYNALTYIDEVHAVGLYGKTGSGYTEQLNVTEEIDVINGTLSKALGSLGGFICANKYFIDVIRSYSSHFIFTSSLTPVNATTSAEAIHIVQNDIALRNKFHANIQRTKKKLLEKGIEIMDNNSHIIPVLVNCAQKCKQICDDLLKEYNIYLQPINYPTVPKGSERLRITPSPMHTDEQIDKLVNALYNLFQRYEVNLFAKKDNVKIQMKL